MADDVTALESASHDPEVTAIAVSRAAIGRLWDVCQIPDYRKISTQNHCELVATLYKFLMGPTERIPADWFAQQVALADRTDGDIDTLANRIAHIRTWTFVSNRAEWLADPEHWRERTRAIEDALSDALHEQLTQRFVDRRTSALMRGLKDKDQLNAEIAADGAVHVERHFVGRLKGFRFYPDTQGEGIHGRATRSAAAHVLAGELALRVRRVVAAKNDALALGKGGTIVWRGEEIGQLEAGEAPLKPLVVLLTDDHLAAADKEKVHARLNAWALEQINERLKPLANLSAAEDISGLARGIAFRLTENFGVLRREMIIEELKSLDQPARAQLRKYGVRFGAFNIYFPLMLKPSCIELAATLWMLKHGATHGLTAMPELPRPGLTSVAAAAGVPEAFYRVAGFHVCGARAVRIDMLERLADLIRPMLAWRAGASEAAPKGATGDGGFQTTGEMMSILGCPADELGDVLRALGFWVQRRRVVSTAGQAGAEPTPPTPAADPAGGIDNGSSAATAPAGGVDNGSAAHAGDTDNSSAAAAPAGGVDNDSSAPAAPAGGTDSSSAPAAPAGGGTDSSSVAAPQPEGGDAWEEVWRPRRKGQALSGKERQQRARHRAHGQGRAKSKPPRRGEGTRREAGQRAPLTSAPTASGAFDPDSPFAALRSLKAALEKRGQE
jgi:ATP-dependent RNA helicase SUPV3L1/SUV3